MDNPNKVQSNVTGTEMVVCIRLKLPVSVFGTKGFIP
jgi:hypothetical protein